MTTEWFSLYGWVIAKTLPAEAVSGSRLDRYQQHKQRLFSLYTALTVRVAATTAFLLS
jgi:hypothetical protein